MKLAVYLKNLLVVLGIMNVGVSFSSTVTLPSEMTPRAGLHEKWNVEIKNKYGEDIMIAARYDDGKMEQIIGEEDKKSYKTRLLHSGDVVRFAKVNTYRPVVIAIWTQGQFGDNPQHVLNKQPLYTYVVDADGNTIFVSLDDNGNLYPQRGEFLGFTGKTQSGLLKTSNVQKKDISTFAAIGKRASTEAQK